MNAQFYLNKYLLLDFPHHPFLLLIFTTQEADFFLNA